MLSFVRRHWLMFVVIAVVGCPFALWGVNNFLWLGMEDWQSLVGSYLAIIAGLFVILAAVIQSQSEERGRRASLLNERRSLATALLAEVRAITLSLKGHQKYLREFRGKLEREPALAQSSSWEGHHFAVINAGVFAAHVGRIGVLPSHLVGKIVAFYGGLASWDRLANIKGLLGAQIDYMLEAVPGQEYVGTLLVIRLRNYLAILNSDQPSREIAAADIEASKQEVDNAKTAAGYVPNVDPAISAFVEMSSPQPNHRGAKSSD